ncbi:MAG TPA: homocysteine S-methyltransferase [Thermoanaerobaculia bacterium]|nr:homocysteine S-methyltransferase [Thermoanaerobaculia bacterium]
MNAQIHDPLASLLDAQGVAILDGGLATTLEANGFDIGGELWSARALVDEPDLLERVHGDFCRAGADCIATATYQATVPGLVRAGLREAEAVSLFARAVELARNASERAFARLEGGEPRQGAAKRRRSLVAASIGPFGAYLADGSEYRGDYRVGRRELVDFHRPRLRALIAARPDLLAFETLPSGIEAMAVLELLDQELSRAGLPGAWLSFQCRDPSSLADGTLLSDVVPALDRHPAILAVGVNCVAPRLVSGLLRTLGALTAKPLAVYPNSGERWQGGDWRGEIESWIEEAPGWVDLGARLIGGCCRTSPEEIARLRQALLPGGGSVST